MCVQNSLPLSQEKPSRSILPSQIELYRVFCAAAAAKMSPTSPANWYTHLHPTIPFPSQNNFVFFRLRKTPPKIYRKKKKTKSESVFEPRIFFDFFSGTQLQSSRLAEWVSECVRECAARIPQHTHYYKYISNDGNQADYRLDRQREIERQFRIKQK